MVRVKGGTTTRARHNKVLKANRGYRGRQKTTWRVAKEAHMKAGTHAYRGRKEKKRTFRALWIQRINAAARGLGTTYSRIIDGLMKSKIVVDRKQLADLAAREPETFKKLAETAEKAASAPARK